MAERAFTVNDKAVKESVLDMIQNISPYENYLVSNLQRSTANDVFHYTIQDTLKTPGLVANPEGADPTYTNTDPTRTLNIEHIISANFKVTDTDIATDRYGSPEDRFAAESDKALQDWAQAAEFALLRSTLVSGGASTGAASARQMRGLKYSVSVVTSQSGISLSETLFNDRLSDVWKLGANVDTVLAPIELKKRISSWSAGGTKFYNQDDKRLVTPIEVYESDASGKPIKIVSHRFMNVAGDTQYDLVGFEADHFAQAYLREPQMREIPRTGDSKNGQVIGELTLEVRNSNAGFLTNNV